MSWEYAKRLTNAALMNVDFVRLSPDSTLRDALHDLGCTGQRYAVVEDDGAFVGLVSDRDLRLALPSRLSTEHDDLLLDGNTVMSVCLRRPFTAHPRGLAFASAQLMIRKRVGCIPIVDHETSTVLGLLTRHDFTRVFAALATEHAADLEAESDVAA